MWLFQCLGSGCRKSISSNVILMYVASFRLSGLHEPRTVLIIIIKSAKIKLKKPHKKEEV